MSVEQTVAPGLVDNGRVTAGGGREGRPDSDLDLLIELESDASVVDILGLDEDLSALLGCRVDVVTAAELESNDLLRRGVNRHRRPLDGAA